MFNLSNSLVRNIYNLLSMFQNFIVENLLSIHHGFKIDLLSHYQKKLLNCNASPVRILATMLRSDLRLVAGQNIAMITIEAKIDLLVVSQAALIDRLSVRRKIPDRDDWILEVVSQLIEELEASNDIEVREEIRQMLDIISIA